MEPDDDAHLADCWTVYCLLSEEAKLMFLDLITPRPKIKHIVGHTENGEEIVIYE